MADPVTRPLSEADKEMIFRKATSGFPLRFKEEIENGMSDADLKTALESVLGIFGGSGGPDQPSIAFAGTGLRIWGSWKTVNSVRDKPLFAGKRTIAMARQIYAIADPDDAQMRLY
ncbi:hypothetical protein WNZ14_09370 [Hoeflea sp. AS60]|uniref:hypothetical protein n=1 Tax=Hoeflea sp. AS60 TaxID=3135780 RepID=UPI00316B0007